MQFWGQVFGEYVIFQESLAEKLQLVRLSIDQLLIYSANQLAFR